MEGRLEQLEAKLPTDLEGVLQFEVHTANGGAEHFHLCLAPSGTEARRGVAADVSAWIEADEDDLVLMLEGRDGAKLRTLGDLGLAQRLFGALASSLKGGSPLGLRAGG